MLGKEDRIHRGLTCTLTAELGLFITTWAFVSINPSWLTINPDPLLVVANFPVKRSILFQD